MQCVLIWTQQNLKTIVKIFPFIRLKNGTILWLQLWDISTL